MQPGRSLKDLQRQQQQASGVADPDDFFASVAAQPKPQPAPASAAAASAGFDAYGFPIQPQAQAAVAQQPGLLPGARVGGGPVLMQPMGGVFGAPVGGMPMYGAPAPAYGYALFESLGFYSLVEQHLYPWIPCLLPCVTCRV